MADDDMIRRGDALARVKAETGFDDDHPAVAALAALPAVTVGVKPQERSHLLHTLREVLDAADSDSKFATVEIDIGDARRLFAVLSALEPQPAALAVPEVRALVEAATALHRDMELFFEADEAADEAERLGHQKDAARFLHMVGRYHEERLHVRETEREADRRHRPPERSHGPAGRHLRGLRSGRRC